MQGWPRYGVPDDRQHQGPTAPRSPTLLRNLEPSCPRDSHTTPQAWPSSQHAALCTHNQAQCKHDQWSEPSLHTLFSGCRSGYFGWGCRFQCQCPDGEACDNVTGVCPSACGSDSWGVGCLLGECSPGVGVWGRGSSDGDRGNPSYGTMYVMFTLI